MSSGRDRLVSFPIRQNEDTLWAGVLAVRSRSERGAKDRLLGTGRTYTDIASKQYDTVPHTGLWIAKAIQLWTMAITLPACSGIKDFPLTWNTVWRISISLYAGLGLSPPPGMMLRQGTSRNTHGESTSTCTATIRRCVLTTVISCGT